MFSSISSSGLSVVTNFNAVGSADKNNSTVVRNSNRYEEQSDAESQTEPSDVPRHDTVRNMAKKTEFPKEQSTNAVESSEKGSQTPLTTTKQNLLRCNLPKESG